MKKLLLLFVCFTLAGLAVVKAQSSASNETEKKEVTVTVGTTDGSTNATATTDAKPHKCSGGMFSKKCGKKDKSASCCKKAKSGCNGKKEDTAPAQ